MTDEYSIIQLARFVNMTVAGVERRIWNGDIPFHVTEDGVRVTAEDADKFRDAHVKELIALLADDF